MTFRTRSQLVAAVTAAAVTGAVLIVPAPAQASTGYYYSGDDTVAIVQNFTDGATVGSVTCGITAVVKKMRKLRGRAGLAGIAALSADISARTAGTSATCKLAKQLALAAATTAAVDLAYGRVFIVDDSAAADCGLVSQKLTYTYRIGPSPSLTTTFSGSVKVPCSF